jgi:hypothetical protein
MINSRGNLQLTVECEAKWRSDASYLQRFDIVRVEVLGRNMKKIQTVTNQY